MRSAPEHEFVHRSYLKETTNTHTHTHTHTQSVCIGFRKGKKPTQPLHKHSHLFYQDKPGQYHERFYEEKSTWVSLPDCIKYRSPASAGRPKRKKKCGLKIQLDMIVSTLLKRFNPLPDMPILVFPSSATNRDMMSKILTDGDTIIWLSRKHCGKRKGRERVNQITSQFLLFPQCFQKLSVVDALKWASLE